MFSLSSGMALIQTCLVMLWGFILYFSLFCTAFPTVVFDKEGTADISTLQLVHLVSFVRVYLFYLFDHIKKNTFFRDVKKKRPVSKKTVLKQCLSSQVERKKSKYFFSFIVFLTSSYFYLFTVFN